MSSSGSKPRISGEQRVFSLVLALIASPQGLTRSELLRNVYGYADREQTRSSISATERMFERDKEQLRELGIPLETLDSPQEPGNNQLTRYRISKERMQLPDDVRFTAEEISLLRIAAMAWSDGSLGSASRWAGLKLSSLGPALDPLNLDIAPRLTIPEPAAAPLQAAIDSGRVVHFDYRVPENQTALRRTVAPLRLHRAEGRWHLLSHDLDRGRDRVFLLERICSEVTIHRTKYDARLLLQVEKMLEDLLAISKDQKVTVSASPGSVAQARLAARAAPILVENHTDLMHIETLDTHALATELASYGDEVTVHAPDEAREQVTGLLEQIRDQHIDVRHNEKTQK